MEEYLTKLENYNPDWVVLQFPNIYGEVKEITISRELFNSSTIQDGFENSDLSKYFGVYDPLYLVPILETYAELEWYPRTVRFISRINRGKERFEKDLIHPYDKTIELLKESNIDLLVKGSVEYTVLDSVSVDRVTKERGPSITIETREARWNPNYIPPLEPSFQSFDIYQPLRQQISESLKKMGFDVESNYHSGTSQHKINFNYISIENFAYQMFSFRNVLRVLSESLGFHSSLMPIVFPNHKPNSVELRIMGKMDVSYFVGGILDNINSILLFTNPLETSYKKLNYEGYYLVASDKNIDGAIVLFDEEKGLIKLDFIDPIANPFLYIPVIIYSGLYGIKKKIEPNVIKTPPRLMSNRELKEKNVKQTPLFFKEVLSNVDENFLKKIFSSDLINDYLEIKYKELESNYNSINLPDYEKYI